jgi:hypothetical protein
VRDGDVRAGQTDRKKRRHRESRSIRRRARQSSYTPVEPSWSIEVERATEQSEAGHGPDRTQC